MKPALLMLLWLTAIAPGTQLAFVLNDQQGQFPQLRQQLTGGQK